MKTCAYCTTENRDEAIFCRRCKRPLQPARPRKDSYARNLVLWIVIALALVALVSYFFSSRPLFAASPTFPPTSAFSHYPSPTRTREPVVLRTCVDDSVHVRRGPGTDYETIGGLEPGACLMILGRNAAGSWVSMVSDKGEAGWVAASLVSDAGDLSKVAIRDDSARRSSSHPTLTSAEIAYGAQAYLTQVGATNLPGAPLSHRVTACFETARRVGEHISCRMEKAYCDYFPDLEGSPTVCNDRPQPDHIFSVVLFGQDWSRYDGQCLIVSGFLRIAEGVLQVEAIRPDQVSPCS